MSAVLANASADFTLDGVAVHLACSSAHELLDALRAFGKAPAANDTAPVGNGAQAPAPAPSKATTATPAGAPKQTAAVSSPAAAPAAAPSQASTAAGDQGNASASTSTQGNAQPAAGGSAPGGEQGNGASAGPATNDAATASSSAADASSTVTFGELKKAFLALANKLDGRKKAEGVLQQFSLAKLSDALPEEHRGKDPSAVGDVAAAAFGPILEAIQKAGA